MMASAGDMRERVVLRSPSVGTAADGGRTLTFAIAGTVWGAVYDLSRVATQALAGGLRPLATRRVVIWKRTDITEAWRVEVGGRTLEIEMIVEDREQQALLCKGVSA